MIVALLWTDKYMLQNTSQIIGHVKAVRKVKDWLIKWKHLTDVDARRLKKKLLKDHQKGKITKDELNKISEFLNKGGTSC